VAGNEKERVTADVSIAADGYLLKPLIIFKGKKIPKFPCNIIAVLKL
jgi:hypothetical protein